MTITPQQLNEIVTRVARSTRLHWGKIINSKLNTTRKIYKDAISVTAVPGKTPALRIKVAAGFPTMLEQGFPRFDMKPGLLKGKSAKFTGHGTGGSGGYTKPMMGGASKLSAKIPIGGKGSGIIRTVRADQTGKWIHPGFKGVQAIPLIKKFASKQFMKQVSRAIKRKK